MLVGNGEGDKRSMPPPLKFSGVSVWEVWGRPSLESRRFPETFSAVPETAKLVTWESQKVFYQGPELARTAVAYIISAQSLSYHRLPSAHMHSLSEDQLQHVKRESSSLTREKKMKTCADQKRRLTRQIFLRICSHSCFSKRRKCIKIH